MKNTKTIMNEMNDADLASLHIKFILPLACGDLLRGTEPMDEVARYTIDDLLGNLEPDAALLCLALCAQNIAAHAASVPLAVALGVEAASLVEDYGPLWLAHQRGTLNMDDESVQDVLSHVPEDLEGMGDLMLALSSILRTNASAPADLCEILGHQAHMHRDYAESRLETISASPEAAAHASANVIQFPRRQP